MLALMSPRLARWMQSSQGTLIAPLRWRRREGESEAAATGVVGSGVDEEEAMAKRPISDRTVDTWVGLLAIVNVEAVSPESEALLFSYIEVAYTSLTCGFAWRVRKKLICHPRTVF